MIEVLVYYMPEQDDTVDFIEEGRLLRETVRRETVDMAMGPMGERETLVRFHREHLNRGTQFKGPEAHSLRELPTEEQIELVEAYWDTYKEAKAQN